MDNVYLFCRMEQISKYYVRNFLTIACTFCVLNLLTVLIDTLRICKTSKKINAGQGKKF